jgi:hypothetical protein
MGDTLAMDLGDGPLQRQRAAAALVHQQVTAETEDHEDHTFAVRLPPAASHPPLSASRVPRETLI